MPDPLGERRLNHVLPEPAREPLMSLTAEPIAEARSRPPLSLPHLAPNHCTFGLKPLAPFCLEWTVWTLRRRPSNLIDRWDGQAYQRVLVIDDKPIAVGVSQTGPTGNPRLQVTLTGKGISRAERTWVRQALERLLGLRVDLSSFYQLAQRDSKLGPLVERFRGVKPPRFPTLFEALANAIACQQMSLSLGILLLGRLTQKFGLPAQETVGPAHAFPRPVDLAELEPEDFRELGFSRQKGRSLIALARAFREHSHQWEALKTLNNQGALESLLNLRGIGRWSAEYALLRGLGRLDVYPGDDVGARNNLRSWLRLRKSLDYEGVHRITRRWQPYAGLVYFHMLLHRLATNGPLKALNEPRVTEGAV